MPYAHRIRKLELELEQLEDAKLKKNTRWVTIGCMSKEKDSNGNFKTETEFELDGVKYPLEEYLERRYQKARAEGINERYILFGSNHKSPVK
jgi:hypothetical protein